MPKIMKLRLRLLKLFRENYWLLFANTAALCAASRGKKFLDKSLWLCHVVGDDGLEKLRHALL